MTRNTLALVTQKIQLCTVCKVYENKKCPNNNLYCPDVFSIKYTIVNLYATSINVPVFYKMFTFCFFLKMFIFADIVTCSTFCSFIYGIV